MSFGRPDPGRPWALDEESADPIFRQAVELGITFWDTANVYGAGSSEEFVGRAVRRYTRRQSVVLATKIHGAMHDGPGGAGLSRKAIIEQVDASLVRLGTDYVDLLQIHRYDDNVPVEETMEALHDIVKAGKARYAGASSMLAWRFAKLQHTSELRGWTKFISMQDQYSLLQREEEREMFGLLTDLGVGCIPWSPLSAGKLARPWTAQPTTRSPNDHAADSYGTPLWYDSDKAIIDAVQRIAAARGVTMAQVALAWVLKNPVVTAPIIGSTAPGHLVEAAAALDLHLTDEEIAALEEGYTPRLHTWF
jgi:aryl-alcohol dehydrogenase-like predicted oxidoreductase